ncbi:MAG: nucleotidyltransferase family protein [Rhodobacteraceae bacterium]|jgi:molybdenum cofactor cytidylyltransferase|uniref:nucleotidyltransferase family protein n=1 Tax=Salipiger TaxID=263377 RepID=UPI0009783D09|nr:MULTISPECIES: nucleotidyltransferase family protein [Salipiger]MAB06474.1 nucleotidyltransferase family protein [Paracoccaceae bacterium]
MGGTAVLIPAAGASRRMRGADKLLREVEGLPLLRRQAQEALRAADHVVVTLPDHDHPRAAALQGLPVQLVAVPDAHLGMSSSLRRGVGLLPQGIDALMVLPADMPDLTAQDLAAVIAAYRAMPQATLQRGTAEDGTPGHPVLFPRDCFPALLALSGDMGAKAVLAANIHRVRDVPLPGRRALTDLDTPEAWQAWEAAQAAE